MNRFSKSAILEWLDKEIARLVVDWAFDTNNGTSQLRGNLGSKDAAIAYGMYSAFLRLRDQILGGYVR